MLVSLIQKLDTTARDAIIQIEEWHLPAAAKLVEGKLDEAGRKVYTLVEEMIAKVEPVAKAEANTVVTEVTQEVTEVKTAVATETHLVETGHGLAAVAVEAANVANEWLK